MALFPTLHAALTTFRAFDLFNNGWLSDQDLEYALIAVGLGDAPKQHVSALLRQCREKANPALASRNNAGSMVMGRSFTAGSFMLGNNSVQQHVQQAHRDIQVTVVSSHNGGDKLSPTSPSSPLGGLHRLRSQMGGAASPSSEPTQRVTLEEFLFLVREMSPAAGSNDEMWRAFKLLDAQQCGRVTLQHLSDVALREGGFSDAEKQADSAADAAYDPAMTYTFDPSPARAREPLEEDEETKVVPVPYGQLQPPSKFCKPLLATFLTAASEVRDANRGATIDDFRTAYRPQR